MVVFAFFDDRRADDFLIDREIGAGVNRDLVDLRPQGHAAV